MQLYLDCDSVLADFDRSSQGAAKDAAAAIRKALRPSRVLEAIGATSGLLWIVAAIALAEGRGVEGGVRARMKAEDARAQDNAPMDPPRR
jgi:hypothetical protein